MTQKTFFFFSSSWRGKDVAVLHSSYDELRVEKVRVEDRADCSSWRKVWQQYVDLIIFTFFPISLEELPLQQCPASWSGTIVVEVARHHVKHFSKLILDILSWKKMAFCITVSQVVSSSSIFSLSVLFSSLSFLKSRFVQKQNDLCKKCFLLQRAILAVTRWASRDPRDFTRNENAKFFAFFLLDDTKCGYKTCC